MNKSKLLLKVVAMTTLLSPEMLYAKSKKADRPNIIFYLTEDLSPQYLKMYMGKGAEMPNLKALASQGVMFNNAYSNASVSSAARTTLITGCYAPRFDGDFHRKIEPLTMPQGLKMFPNYIRQAGYYTVNARKTDYNVKLDKDAWDIIGGKLGDWRKRKDKSQPFFFQRSNNITHESKLQFSEQVYKTVKTIHNPEEVYIQPYLPKTKLMKYTFATIYDRIRDCDDEIGKMVDMLKEDNLLDNTFIFFMGDNGGTLPGTKGYTNDLGYHVPLVLYVPSKWRDKMNFELGSRTDKAISFMDLGPTAISMAGGKVPEQMDGKVIFKDGKIIGNKEVFCYGDRYDEYYSFNRCIYQGKYRYARNYNPDHTRSLYANYRYKQLAFAEWKDLFNQGVLNEHQSRFFEPMGCEELYDLNADPDETTNLAVLPEYQKMLKKFRSKLDKYMIEKADLGFFPETVIYSEGMYNPATYGEKNRDRIAKFIKIADLQMKPYVSARQGILDALNSSDPVENWWGLSTCASFGARAKDLQSDVAKLLNNKHSYVKVRALVALASLGARVLPKDFTEVINHCSNGAESTLVLNDIMHMIEMQYIPAFKLNISDFNGKTEYITRRVDYINTLVK